jgi:hypothetical protein
MFLPSMHQTSSRPLWGVTLPVSHGGCRPFGVPFRAEEREDWMVEGDSLFWIDADPLPRRAGVA